MLIKIGIRIVITIRIDIYIIIERAEKLFRVNWWLILPILFMVTGAKSAGKNPYRQYGTRNASGTTGKEGQVYFGRQKYKKKN